MDRRTSRAAWAITRHLCALLVFFSFANGFNFQSQPRAPYLNYLDGTAHRPYVGRVLVSGFVTRAVGIVPEASRRPLGDALLDGTGLRTFLGDAPYDHARPLEHALGLLFVLACFFLLAEVHHRWVLTAYRGHVGWLSALTPLMLASIPAFFRFRYLHDIPGMALFVACMLAIERRYWWGFAALVSLAALNKETAILLPFVALYIAHRRGELNRETLKPPRGGAPPRPRDPWGHRRDVRGQRRGRG